MVEKVYGAASKTSPTHSGEREREREGGTGGERTERSTDNRVIAKDDNKKIE